MQSRLSEQSEIAPRPRRWVGCRLVCAVPPSHRRDGIAWLSIEHGPADRGGYVLFCCRQRDDDTAEPDSWHRTLQLALHEAGRSLGVDTGSWTVE